MYGLPSLKAYCHQRYGDWSGVSFVGPYFNFSFYSRLYVLHISIVLNRDIATLLQMDPCSFIFPFTYQCSRYARISHEVRAVWRATDADEGCHRGLDVALARP